MNFGLRDGMPFMRLLFGGALINWKAGGGRNVVPIATLKIASLKIEKGKRVPQLNPFPKVLNVLSLMEPRICQKWESVYQRQSSRHSRGMWMVSFIEQWREKGQGNTHTQLLNVGNWKKYDRSWN
jgi:hypothetical protein